MIQIAFFKGTGFNTLETTVISELESVQDRVNANKLTINFDPQKSCYSVFKPLDKQCPESFEEALSVLI